ncbi:MAG: hypothetical protein JO053_01035 [Acidobacteria bacterium]|nr:hypothetical protein [Acidobacteriota bacterium]
MRLTTIFNVAKALATVSVALEVLMLPHMPGPEKGPTHPKCVLCLAPGALAPMKPPRQRSTILYIAATEITTVIKEAIQGKI